MTIQELYLKTIFCCMACDGDIASEEVDLIKSIVKKTDLFDGLDVETLLNSYISEINNTGKLFLNRYLSSLSEETLTPIEELNIISLAIKMIEADNIIQYSEVKFFKKIRVRLDISDEQILEKFPDKEDFLMPDIDVYEEPMWDNVTFASIALDMEEKQ